MLIPISTRCDSRPQGNHTHLCAAGENDVHTPSVCVVEYVIPWVRAPRYLDRSSAAGRGPAAATVPYMGPTGFDTIALREEAGRGLLATLNRGTVKMN